MKTTELRSIMLLAWQFVKRNGYTLSEALSTAWLNFKLVRELKSEIVEFYYQKMDGSLRQAFGTLQSEMLPATAGTKKNIDTCQVYFDTEKGEWRCFKKSNLRHIGRLTA